LKITETDCDGNHIKISTKQIVISNHKIDSQGKKDIDIPDDELVGFLRKGFGKHIMTNKNDKLYQSSSAFIKMF
jgi:hypothetical protein